MDEQLILERFFQVIALGLRHRDYKHVVKKRKLYMQLVAGIEIDKLLRQYVKREDGPLFKQRVALTHHIVTTTCKNLTDVFYKVPRSNSGRRGISYATSKQKGVKAEESKAEELENVLRRFWGVQSWDDYMSTRFIELNEQDPNTFVVFEWDSFDPDNELLQPRPFEVSSIAAIDYKFKNQILQYLIVEDKYHYSKKVTQAPAVGEQHLEIEDPKKFLEAGNKYTLYMPNRTVILEQVNDAHPVFTNTVKAGAFFTARMSEDEETFVRLGKRFFRVRQPEAHNLGHVPAFRPGYIRDPETDGRTFVNLLHGVEPLLLKTIKTNSELDLVAAGLAMPQMLRFGRKCTDDQCHGGQYPDGTTCKTCQGTDVEPFAPSSMDAIVLPMPESKEEMIPLKDILDYKHPPVEIVKWQEAYIESLTNRAKKAMFNSDVFSRKEVSDTATGRNLDVQNVYDTLYPFTLSFSRIWAFGVNTVAKLVDRGEGLVAFFTFGKDFKLKSLDTLIQDLLLASKINNPTLIRHLNSDIAHIIFADKPLELNRFKMKEMFDPFAGKSEREAERLMQSNYVSLSEKILHANFSLVFDELELDFAKEEKNFYKLNRTDQRAAIYKKVDEIKARIDEENPAPTLNFNE